MGLRAKLNHQIRSIIYANHFQAVTPNDYTHTQKQYESVLRTMETAKASDPELNITSQANFRNCKFMIKSRVYLTRQHRLKHNS